MVYFIWCVDKFCRIKIVRPILFTLAYERQLLKTSVTLEFTVGWGKKVYKKKMDITQGICQLYQKSSFCHDLHNVDSMVRNCCRSIRSKMRVTWRRNVAGNLIALAVVTAFVVTYVKLLQYNKASSTTFNLVANRHRRPRGLHASHTVHRGSKNATSRLAVHVVEEHHQGKCYTSQLTV